MFLTQILSTLTNCTSTVPRSIGNMVYGTDTRICILHLTKCIWRAADKRCYPSTWQIRFNLGAVISGVYKLRLSIASATPAYLQVRVNDQNESQPLFGISGVGGDNTIARHGIHGVYRLFSIDVISSLLVEGDNTIFLTLAKGGDEFLGVLYDYVRLESPWTSERPQWCITGIDHIQDDCPSKLFRCTCSSRICDYFFLLHNT